jgi:hypothetical protein
MSAEQTLPMYLCKCSDHRNTDNLGNHGTKSNHSNHTNIGNHNKNDNIPNQSNYTCS